MRGLIAAAVLLMGCGEAVGEMAYGLHDGGSCEHPERLLYELELAAIDGDCGEIQSRVRRLDGPSHAGSCTMQVSPGSEACGIGFTDVCATDYGSLVVDGELGPGLMGAAVVERTGPDGAVICVGTYDVLAIPVY